MDTIRKQILKEVTTKKPYVYVFFITIIIYFLINAWANQLFVTGLGIFQSFRISFLIPFVILLIVVPLLVGLNISLVVHKFKTLKKISKKGVAGSGSIGMLGIFAGVLGGACPGCLVGLFPAFLGIFGSTGTSLSVLPYNGLELQAASVGFLLIGAYYLTKPVTCRVDFGTTKPL